MSPRSTPAKAPLHYTGSARLRQDVFSRVAEQKWRAPRARAVVDLINAVAQACYGPGGGFEPQTRAFQSQLAERVLGTAGVKALKDGGIRQVRRSLKDAALLGYLEVTHTRPQTIHLNDHTLTLLRNPKVPNIPRAKRTSCPVVSGHHVRLEAASHLIEVPLPSEGEVLPTEGNESPVASLVEEPTQALAEGPETQVQAPAKSDPMAASAEPITPGQVAGAIRVALDLELPRQSSSEPNGVSPGARNRIIGVLKGRAVVHPDGIAAGLQATETKIAGLRPFAASAMESGSIDGWAFAALLDERGDMQKPKPRPQAKPVQNQPALVAVAKSPEERLWNVHVAPRRVGDQHKASIMPALAKACRRVVQMQKRQEFARKLDLVERLGPVVAATFELAQAESNASVRGLFIAMMADGRFGAEVEKLGNQIIAEHFDLKRKHMRTQELAVAA